MLRGNGGIRREYHAGWIRRNGIARNALYGKGDGLCGRNQNRIEPSGGGIIKRPYELVVENIKANET